MIARHVLFFLILFQFVVTIVAGAEVILPSEEQTILKRGVAQLHQGVRTVAGSVDATGHGPMTYYTVPFRRGTFSLSWKASNENRVVFVFIGKANGKGRMVLKVNVKVRRVRRKPNQA